MLATTTLPDGLEIDLDGPEWLSTLWPFSDLNTSIGSVVLTLTILVVILGGSAVLAYVCKTFFARVPGLLAQGFFLLVALVAGIGSIYAGMQWFDADNVSDETMGREVYKVHQYAMEQGVMMTNEIAWELTCNLYEDKNAHCTPGNAPAEVQFERQTYKVALERNATTGEIEIMNYSNGTPLGY